MQLIESKIELFVDRLENNKYISNLRGVIVSICFPMVLTGSIFYIAANPPRGTNLWLFKLWLSSAIEVRDALMVPYYFTWGMVSVVFVFVLSYRLSREFSLEPVLPAVVSTLSFLALCFAGNPGGNFTLERISKITGPNGILLAFLTVITCIKTFRFLDNKKLYFDIKSGLSPSLSQGLKNLFAVMVIIPIMWITGWILGGLFGEPLPSGITTVLGYFISWNSDLARDITGSIITSALYFAGMDGGIIKQPVYNVFMNQGGFGNLLPLVVLFMLSYSRHLKQIGKSVIVPVLFNIPYPVIFAVPIMLNPIYLIPFILFPILSTVINYFILSSGILAVTVEATLTMPVILSGYFSTTGQVIGILLQLFNFALSVLIYYPFFLYHESRLIRLYGTEKEKAAAIGPSLCRIKMPFLALIKKVHQLYIVKRGRPLTK